MPPQKPIVGLIGGMGSGKSRVAQAFARHGGFLVAGDLLGHEALAQPDILARIAQRWGDRALAEDGKVDRKKLGKIVFASPVERANLELLVFPYIEKRIREELAVAQASAAPFVVLDAAIMLEAGWNKECAWIVYVDAPREARLQRLAAQRNWNADDLANREYAQLPLAVKASRADVAVDNSGTLEDTQKQVDTLIQQWRLNVT
jgi:dephospho-CoA kinase